MKVSALLIAALLAGPLRASSSLAPVVSIRGSNSAGLAALGTAIPGATAQIVNSKAKKQKGGKGKRSPAPLLEDPLKKKKTLPAIGSDPKPPVNEAQEALKEALGGQNSSSMVGPEIERERANPDQLDKGRFQTPSGREGRPNFDPSDHPMHKLDEERRKALEQLQQDGAMGGPGSEDTIVDGEDPSSAFQWEGDMRQALEQMRSLSAGEDLRGASKLAGFVLDETNLNRLAKTDAERAELKYAAGVVAVLSERPAVAASSFRSAGALAGPGELRGAALFNAGVALIEEGEVAYNQITEVRAKEAQQNKSLVKQSDPMGTGMDTLPIARERFLVARSALLDRLRLDWNDQDTRANLEYVQRRLSELDEIERKRDEEFSSKQENSGQETEQSESGEEDRDGQNRNEDNESEESGQSGVNDEQEGEPESESKSDPTPGEGADEGAEQPNPNAPEEEDAESQKLEDAETGREEETDEDAAEGEAGAPEKTEETMSQPEKVVLLDLLADIEKQARLMRAALARSRRVEVERDW